MHCNAAVTTSAFAGSRAPVGPLVQAWLTTIVLAGFSPRCIQNGRRSIRRCTAPDNRRSFRNWARGGKCRIRCARGGTSPWKYSTEAVVSRVTRLQAPDGPRVCRPTTTCALEVLERGWLLQAEWAPYLCDQRDLLDDADRKKQSMPRRGDGDRPIQELSLALRCGAP